MKRETYETQFVEYMPEELVEGVLYLAPHFGSALHKCMCGCGEVVSTPLGEGGWSYNYNEIHNAASLHPSIGNYQQKCKSHYFLKNGKVQWC